jgi:hypothetical protein
MFTRKYWWFASQHEGNCKHFNSFTKHRMSF